MKHKYLFITVGLGVVCAVAVFVLVNKQTFLQPDSSLINIHGPTSSPTSITTSSRPPVPTLITSSTHMIAVPFSPQAPTGNWDAVHEEMCEEVTIIMAHAWVNGIALSPAFTEGEIQKLVAWENKNFGTYIDTSARQTAQMAQAIYGLHTSIVDNPTVDQIKKQIDNGNIVIMGMAGRMLHNPNYTGAGPLYHMLLIKGYDATGFITNDDGTRNGNSYHYSYTTLMAAAHDWSGDAASLTSNPSAAIVVSK